MVRKIPLDISQASTDLVTLYNTVANIESVAAVITAPPLSVIEVEEGAPIYLEFRTSAGALISDGLVRIYIESAAGDQRLKVAEAPVAAFTELADQNKQYKIRRAFRVREKGKIIITLTAPQAAAANQTKLLIRASLETF